MGAAEREARISVVVAMSAVVVAVRASICVCMSGDLLGGETLKRGGNGSKAGVGRTSHINERCEVSSQLIIGSLGSDLIGGEISLTI